MPIREGATIPLELDQWKGQGTILVVDDEETVRAVARKILTKKGFTVLTAEDGRAGLKIYQENPDNIDLVILDITMPHMGGEETYSEMRKIRPNVRVLISSGYNEEEATAKFSGKGLAGFIQKPYRLTELIEKLNALLG
jgi:two-component system cell cycle sensor histidine kinase/response regulator CckA